MNEEEEMYTGKNVFRASGKTVGLSVTHPWIARKQMSKRPADPQLCPQWSTGLLLYGWLALWNSNTLFLDWLTYYPILIRWSQLLTVPAVKRIPQCT